MNNCILAVVQYNNAVYTVQCTCTCTCISITFHAAAVFEAPTLFSVHLSEAVVAHFVHEAVEQDWRSLTVDSELSLRCEVVGLFDVLAFLSAASNTNHPKKLIDV